MTTAFLKTPARSVTRRSPPPHEPVHDHDKPPPLDVVDGGRPRILLVHALLAPGSTGLSPGLALTWCCARPVMPTRSSLPPRAPIRPARTSAIEVEDDPTD